MELNTFLSRSSPGLIKQFVEDLHSGKLHREFHHGPDPTQKTAETPVCTAVYI